MSASVVRRLVIKDLYLYRSMSIGLLAGSAILLGTSTLSRTGLYVSSILLFCLLLIVQIFLVTASAQTERKERTLLFVLSLPVSPMQYAAAKVLSSIIGYVLPWAIVTAASVAVIAASPIPNGAIAFTVTMSTYIVAYHCVLLAVTLLSESTAGTTAVIIVGNIVPSFLIPFLITHPTVHGSVAVWPREFLATLTLEIALGGLALAAALYLFARKKAFV